MLVLLVWFGFSAFGIFTQTDSADGVVAGDGLDQSPVGPLTELAPDPCEAVPVAVLGGRDGFPRLVRQELVLRLQVVQGLQAVGGDGGLLSSVQAVLANAEHSGVEFQRNRPGVSVEHVMLGDCARSVCGDRQPAVILIRFYYICWFCNLRSRALSGDPEDSETSHPALICPAGLGELVVLGCGERSLEVHLHSLALGLAHLLRSEAGDDREPESLVVFLRVTSAIIILLLGYFIG